MHCVPGWSLGNLRYRCPGPSPLWLHPRHCLPRKGNHRYSAEVQEGPPRCCPPGGMQTGLAHLGYSNPTHGCQPRCLHCDSSPRRASLLSQGPLGHQCQGSQEALCVGSYLVLFSSLWSEPHLCIDTKIEAFWGHCGCFSPRHNSPWAHTHMSLVEFLTLLLGGSD